MPSIAPTDDGDCSLPSSPSSRRPTSDPKDAWPIHPIPALRGPFDESIAEAMDPDARIRRTLDAAARRLQLLELDEFPEDYSSRWRHKPDSKFHPLWKLIAQISFGIHLLHQHTAKSEEEVIRILQTHIDEVDGFLEDTHADFDLAIRDIDERARLLQLSLDHGRTFGRMLRAADFRANILHGNDVIERIIHRTSKALKTSMDDVRKGIEATAEFAKYLDRVRREWTHNNEDMEGVYEAMRGNAEGWYCCFTDIEEKATRLKALMARLGALVGEVARRAGIASRKVMREKQARSRSQDSHTARMSLKPSSPDSPSRSSLRRSMSKPLPPDPLRRSRIAPIEKPLYTPNIRIQHRPPEQEGNLLNPTPVTSPLDGPGAIGSQDPANHSDTQDIPISLDGLISPRNPVAQPRRASSAAQSTLQKPLSPPFTSSSANSPLTPNKLLEALELQQGAVDRRASDLLHLTPLGSPLTPSKLLQALQQSKNASAAQDLSQGPFQSSSNLESPLTPGKLLRTLDPYQNGGIIRLEEAPMDRPMTSPPPTEMKIPMPSAEARRMSSLMEETMSEPPASAPLRPSSTRFDSSNSGEIIIARPLLSPVQPDLPAASPAPFTPVPFTPDHEEKQVMSNETFLMLDDPTDSVSRLVDVPEVDEKAEERSEGQALSRRNTASTGRRSRPHSSYSVVEAYRKSKLMASGVSSNDAGDDAAHPPVPAVPKLPLQVAGGVKRVSTGSAAPPLTKSGSTTSVSSAQNVAIPLRIEAFEDHDPLDRAMSPQGPAIADDGLMEQIRHSARNSATKSPALSDASQLSRSRSADPFTASAPGSDAAFPDPWRTSQMLRSSSNKSHKRVSQRSAASAATAATAASKVTSTSMDRPDSWISEKVVVVRPPSAKIDEPIRRPPPPPLPPPPPPPPGASVLSRKPVPVHQRPPREEAMQRMPRLDLEASSILGDGVSEMGDTSRRGSSAMVSTFTPLSPSRSATPASYRLMPKVPPSPGAESRKEALPTLPPADPKPKKFGTLKRPVNAFRGLLSKKN